MSGWQGQNRVDELAEVKPTVLALYGKDMNAINTFWASIPRANDPTAPMCYDYAWPADASSDFPTTQGRLLDSLFTLSLFPPCLPPSQVEPL